MKKAIQKYGYAMRVSEHELISALTNPNDIRYKGGSEPPSIQQVSWDLLYGGNGDEHLVGHDYLYRLIRKWKDLGYVFEDGGRLYANKDLGFDWGLYRPNKEILLEGVPGHEHHYEFWLVPDDGYALAYRKYYAMCGTLTSGARNAGQKRVVIDELRLYGLNVLGLKDYNVYAYPRRGIKCNCYVDGYKTLEEVHAMRAHCKQAVQRIVQNHARGAIGGNIAFRVDAPSGGEKPHTTVPGKMDIILPTLTGSPVILEAEGENGSHPGDAETSDPAAPAAIDYTNKLVDKANEHAKSIETLRQDYNQLVTVVAQLPAVIKQMAENQVLAAKASDEAAKHTDAQIAQLTSQIGSLVQILQQQQDARAYG